MNKRIKNIKCSMCKCKGCNNICKQCNNCDKDNIIILDHCQSFDTDYNLCILEAMLELLIKVGVRCKIPLGQEWESPYILRYRPFDPNNYNTLNINELVSKYMDDFIMIKREEFGECD